MHLSSMCSVLQCDLYLIMLVFLILCVILIILQLERHVYIYICITMCFQVLRNKWYIYIITIGYHRNATVYNYYCPEVTVCHCNDTHCNDTHRNDTVYNDHCPSTQWHSVHLQLAITRMTQCTMITGHHRNDAMYKDHCIIAMTWCMYKDHVYHHRNETVHNDHCPSTQWHSVQ